MQNLHYTYDPVGNITHIQDDAQQTIYFANAQVEPSSDYVYDALYRLIEATGRENAAAVGAPPQPEGPWPTGSFPSPDATRRLYPALPLRPRRQHRRRCAHRARQLARPSHGSWTRYYALRHRQQPSARDLARPTPDWNSSSATDKIAVPPRRARQHAQPATPPPDRFDLRWDWSDMIHTIDLGGGGRAWYQYGIDKQRSRKRIVRNPAVNGTLREDRIYLGGYELYRRYTSDPHEPVEEIESHHLFEGDQRVLLVDDVITASPRQSAT